MQDINLSALGALGQIIAYLVPLAVLLLHIAFAVCIATDMTRRHQQGRDRSADTLRLGPGGPVARIAGRGLLLGLPLLQVRQA